MCFSAPASFAAGAVLAAVGCLTWRRARNARELPLATIPWIFSLQQLAEGVIWLNAARDPADPIVQVPAYIFLICAQVVWPFWIPFATLTLEPDRERRKYLSLFVIIGVVLAAYLAACLMIYGATAVITGHHIHYQCDYPPHFSLVSSMFYGFATIIPTLISGRFRLPVLGLAIAASYVITVIFYQYYTISVWCYFSAIISVLVWFVLGSTNQDTPHARLSLISRFCRILRA